jgi:hypothetical protein
MPIVEPEPVVVNPVELPVIVNVLLDGVAEPESASKVVETLPEEEMVIVPAPFVIDIPVP